jgi:hypothetical protein
MTSSLNYSQVGRSLEGFARHRLGLAPAYSQTGNPPPKAEKPAEDKPAEEKPTAEEKPAEPEKRPGEFPFDNGIPDATGRGLSIGVPSVNRGSHHS